MSGHVMEAARLETNGKRVDNDAPFPQFHCAFVVKSRAVGSVTHVSSHPITRQLGRVV